MHKFHISPRKYRRLRPKAQTEKKLIPRGYLGVKASIFLQLLLLSCSLEIERIGKGTRHTRKKTFHHPKCRTLCPDRMLASMANLHLTMPFSSWLMVLYSKGAVSVQRAKAWPANVFSKQASELANVGRSDGFNIWLKAWLDTPNL